MEYFRCDDFKLRLCVSGIRQNSVNQNSISSLKFILPISVRYFILRCIEKEEESRKSSFESGVPERVVVAVSLNGVVLDFDW